MIMTLSPLSDIVYAEPSAVPAKDTAIASLKSNQLLLYIKGMVCGMCVQGITKTVGALKGVRSVKIDLDHGSALVNLEEGISISEAILREAVKDAGYELQDVHSASSKPTNSPTAVPSSSSSPQTPL